MNQEICKNYKILNLKKSGLDLAIEWAAKEGWNPGLYDSESFYNADPDGFLVGEVDGEPVSTVSCVRYGDSYGFIGFYIVKPEYRGMGYGMEIWKAAMKRLEGRNIGLDGVPAQQENYAKSGFKFAYRNIRFEGKGCAQERVPDNIVNLNEVSFKGILDYDRNLFPVPRPEFLEKWIAQRESRSLGIIKNKSLAGYGVIRPCRSGYKIGPLFADDPACAEALYLSLLGCAPDKQVCLDVPETNREAMALTERYKMTKVFETARMYTQKEPDIDINRVFGVTTFELG